MTLKGCFDCFEQVYATARLITCLWISGLSKNNKTMTYNELLEQLPLTLTIPTLGGRNSLTVYNLQGGLLVENSKGSTYQLSREDWINAKRIRAAYSRNPWKSRHFTGLTDLYSYSLVYAAALLRHIEPGEADDAEPQNFRRVLQARDAA
jgi:hypothetical protein